MPDDERFQIAAEQECPAGRIRIETEPGAMRAALSLYPAPGGAPFTAEEVNAALALAGVVHGVDADALSAAIVEVQEAAHPVERRIVAVGRPPESGADARLEYPPLQRQRRPEDLGIDPLTLCQRRVISVRAEETVAVYHALVDGMPGLNVNGEYVPAKASADTTPRAGRNVRREGDCIVAQVDGRLIIEKQSVHVDENLVIEGDLTVLRGDIDFVGAIYVRGNIESGLTLRGERDILVSGSIFGSDVVCRGSLRVRHGIVGSGETKVEVHGDLEAEFVENIELIVRGSCQINKSIVNARVLCGQTLAMPGYGHVVSGQIYARDGIRVAQVGVANGATVKLVVGVDAIATQRIVEIDRELDGIEERLRKVKDLLAEMGPTVPAYLTLSPQRRREIDQLAAMIEPMTLQRESLQVERAEVMQKMKKNNDAIVSVRGLVHEDTIIQFPYDRLVVRELAKRVTYAYDLREMRILTQGLAA